MVVTAENISIDKLLENQDLIVITKDEYKEFLRCKNNIDYLEKLDKSYKQLENGEVVIKSMEELEAMANE